MGEKEKDENSDSVNRKRETERSGEKNGRVSEKPNELFPCWMEQKEKGLLVEEVFL